MKYFLKKLLGHEIFSSMVSLSYEFFFEKFVKPSGPPPTYLMYAPLLCTPFIFIFLHLMHAFPHAYAKNLHV